MSSASRSFWYHIFFMGDGWRTAAVLERTSWPSIKNTEPVTMTAVELHEWPEWRLPVTSTTQLVIPPITHTTEPLGRSSSEETVLSSFTCYALWWQGNNTKVFWCILPGTQESCGHRHLITNVNLWAKIIRMWHATVRDLNPNAPNYHHGQWIPHHSYALGW